MTPICALDIESTGLHPDRLAWEVGMIRRDEHGQSQRSFFIEVDLSDAEPKALEIGRFYERHPRGKHLSGGVSPGYVRHLAVGGFLPTAEAAAFVARYTHGAHIIGAVPSFDMETLAKLLRQHGLIPGWHHRLVCVESLASGHLGRYVGGLTRCADALGISVDPEAEHTALGDARVALAIWDQVIDERGAESG